MTDGGSAVGGAQAWPGVAVPAHASVAPMQGGSSDARFHLVLAGGALLGAIALVGWGLSREPARATSGCSEAPGIETVWSEGPASEVHAAFAATGLPQAESSFALIRRDLDAYARTWSAAQAQLCSSPNADRSEPPPVEDPDAVRWCLQRRRSSLQAFVTELRDADAQVVLQAPLQLALALPPVLDCGLPSLRPRQAVDELAERRLDALHARLAVGRVQQAKAQLEPLRPDTIEAGDPTVARTFFLLGVAALRSGDVAGAEAALEQATWAAIEARDDPLAMQAALALAETVATKDEEADRAQQWWRLASAMGSRMGLAPHREHALLLGQAALLRRQGELAAALPLYERGLQALEDRFGSTHPVLAQGLQGAAEAAAGLGKVEPAIGLHERATTLLADALGPSHPRVRRLQRDFAAVLVGAGYSDPAARYFRASLESLADLPTADDVLTAIALGQALAAQQQYREAEAAFDRGRHLYERGSMSDAGLRADIDLGLGLTALQSGDPERALEQFDAALQRQQQADPPDPILVATTLTRIGKTSTLLGRTEAGIAALRDAAALLEAGLGPEDPRTAEGWLALAEGRMTQGRPKMALELARRALEVLAGSRGAEHPSTLDALATIGTASLSLDRPKDAAAAFEQAVTVAHAIGAPAGQRASAQLGLATALWQADEKARARAIIDEVRTLVQSEQPGGIITEGDLDAWLKRRGLSM